MRGNMFCFSGQFINIQWVVHRRPGRFDVLFIPETVSK